MKKVFQISLVLLTTLAFGASWWFFSKTTENSKMLKTLSFELDALKIRAEADELFLQGKTNDALALYLQYDSITNDSLQQRRIAQSIFSASSSESEKLQELSFKLQQTQKLLNDYEAREKDFMFQEVSSASQDDRKLLEEEVKILREKLSLAQKEIQSAKGSKGVLQFSSSKNGSVTYFGDVQNGKANGTGFGYWKSGSTYDGQWKDNMRHGKGVFLWADGEKYEGDYQNDQRQGYGIYFAKAGRYEGHWENDMRHGEGHLYEPNGKLKVHGIWEKDKLVKTLK